MDPVLATLRAMPAEGTTVKISSKDFRVREGDDVDLKKWPTMVDSVSKSNEQCQELPTDTSRISVLSSIFLTRPTIMPSCWCSTRWARQVTIARSH